MGRKRKQVDIEGESKTSLPPCRVCDAPGAGFHYGANTCEACKGFFHRSLKISSNYKCDADGSCVIEHGGNRLCQYCRYQKCLSVGMAKEAIKTGRYTSIKRTNDILEIKRLQEKKIIDPPSPPGGIQNQPFLHHCIIDGDGGDENSLDYDNQAGECSLLFENSVRQFSSGCMSQENSVRQFSSGCVSQDNSEISDSVVLNRNSGSVAAVCEKSCASLSGQVLAKTQACVRLASLVKAEISPSASTLREFESLFSESPNLDLLQAQQQNTNITCPAVSPPLSITSSPYDSPSQGSVTKPSPNLITDAASSLLSLSSAATLSSGPSPSPACAPSTASMSLHSPSSVPSVHSPAVFISSPGSTMTSPASSVTHATSSSSISSLDVQLYISDSPNSNCDNGTDISMAELYKDKDLIVTILEEAHENIVVPLLGKISEEEIKRQQHEHFEACKLQREIFGQLRRLPDHEYDYIFATTGLDTDDRQKRLRIMGAGLEKVIRAMVKFCKIIPGFCRLDISDKVKLIKYSRQEFCLFTIYKFIDVEKRIMRGLDNQWKCENEITRMSGPDVDSSEFMDNLDLHFRFCGSLQNLKLSDEELVVIRALIIMAPDRDPHVESLLAREIYWELNECLIHVLSKRYPNPLTVYARIMSKLTEARSQTDNMVRFFKRLKIDKYSNMRNNPLLREMCSGIFFDEKDDNDDIINLNS